MPERAGRAEFRAYGSGRARHLRQFASAQTPSAISSRAREFVSAEQTTSAVLQEEPVHELEVADPGWWMRCRPHSNVEQGTTAFHQVSFGSSEVGWPSHPGWLVGRSRISFSVIRRGRVTANAITSATSSAVMASCA